MSGWAFDLAGVSVTLGRTAALRDVDLSIASGEAVALIGPSGSGKTTLLRTLTGAVEPSAGTLRVGGSELGRLDERARRSVRASVGFVHQDLALVPVLRVLQNVVAARLGRDGVLSGLRRVALPRAAEVREVHALLERVGIDDLLYQRVDHLSGGQQQRVAIARALYQEPRALLADEPVSAVDPVRSRAIVDLLLELARERGATLVASLHDVDLARERFPRIVGLREGRVELDARSPGDGRPVHLDPDALDRLFRDGAAGV
ncbi:MAG: ATP-binding cassette domain-containing protein [Planctomycetota bacterium]